jgi:uncharacterized membrane protein YgdD (TMEM256/DUF423 family)
MNRILAVAGAAAGAAAVVFGAFGVHALRGHLDNASLQTWHTAVDYQFWHALALLLIAHAASSRWQRASGICFVIGLVSFCGSLYALALGAPPLAGAITPLGGAALILGWLFLGAAFWRAAK